MNTRVKVETKDEISRIKALWKEIEQFKKQGVYYLNITTI